MPGKLYLIPSFIGDANPELYLPTGLTELLSRIPVIFTENAKTTRRFMKSCGISPPYDAFEFYIVDKKTDETELLEAFQTLYRGNDAALVSEAGAPAIADPGSELIKLAHDSGIRVIPLPGPSSFVQALSASGLNGQQFVFHGYLPIQEQPRTKMIKRIDQEAYKSGYTQIFMETPYRNPQLFKSLLKALNPKTRLCMALSINSVKEDIRTMLVRDWKTIDFQPEKLPAVWLINRS